VPKRYADGLYDLLRCSADLCDAGNCKIERQADRTVPLRTTGGLYVGPMAASSASSPARCARATEDGARVRNF
jgi:hypothetical protein